MPDSSFREAMRRLHDVYHADPEADLHMAPPREGLIQQPQPGTADFMQQRLIGSQAPEKYIERWDAVGPEGFGPVEICDQNGNPIAKISSRTRRRLEGR